MSTFLQKITISMIAYFGSGCDCFFDQIQIRPVYKKGGIRYTENARYTFQNSV